MNQNRSAGVRIAILDSGADLTNPLIADRLVATKDFCGAGIGNGQDTHGHGTALAGIIIGTAHNALLLVGRIMTQSGLFTFDALSDGIRWATQHEADIICISSGDLIYDAELHLVIKQATNEMNTLIVGAIGNGSRVSPNAGYFPARFGECLAAGAIDENGVIPSFCDRNSQADTIYAPGVEIPCLSLSGKQTLRSGTSLSAAYVAAVAGLFLHSLRQEGKDVSALSLKDMLLKTAEVRCDHLGKYCIINRAALDVKGK